MPALVVLSSPLCHLTATLGVGRANEQFRLATRDVDIASCRPNSAAEAFSRRVKRGRSFAGALDMQHVVRGLVAVLKKVQVPG